MLRSLVWHRALAVTVGVAMCVCCVCVALANPAMVVWDGARLAKLRANPDGHASLEQRAMDELLRQADLAIQKQPGSVMEKEVAPPSGDKHDYQSFGTYWWPDPAQPEGLPYVRRDGYTNYDQIAKGDSERLGEMMESVTTLTLAGYLTNDNKYSDAAVRRLEVWFLDPATRMNPHLNYGQAILGVTEGRCFGIIDTAPMVYLLDAILLLQESGKLTAVQAEGLRAWFDAYLTWLLESEIGQLEQQSENNHGTWYAAQVARMALAVDRPEVAKQTLQKFRDSHLPHMFAADGTQPLEMSRTKSLDYARFNLVGLLVLARCGDRVGVDLWNEPRDGTSMKAGIDFLAPYLQFEKPWAHTQITKQRFTPATCRLLLLAHAKFGDDRYIAFLRNKDMVKPGAWMVPLLTQEVPADSVTGAK